MLAILSQGAGWNSTDGAGIAMRDIDDISNNVDNAVASMRSFKCRCVYIIALIVNELIEDNSVKESIVH